MESLDASCVEEAVTDPLGFRRRKTVPDVETVDGQFDLELAPYGVACVKGVVE